MILKQNTDLDQVFGGIDENQFILDTFGETYEEHYDRVNKEIDEIKEKRPKELEEFKMLLRSFDNKKTQGGK